MDAIFFMKERSFIVELLTKENNLDYYVHKLDQGKLGAMFVSDEKALKYHLDKKQEVDLEKGIWD